MTKKKLTKKQKKKLSIIIVSVIIIIFTIITIYLVSKDIKQEDILKNEINNMINTSDISKDDYKSSIKTGGDYAIVEKTIKEYWQKYAKNFQELMEILDDKTLSNCLSADNYKNDGKEFTKTKEYIKSSKEKMNQKTATLSKMLSEDYIKKQIKEKHLDKYYNNLYEELMLKGTAKEDFTSATENLEKISDKINNILSVEEEVINLLSNNQDKWNVGEDKIIFKDTDLLNQYNTLVAKLPKN